MRLYELLLAHTVALVVRPAGQGVPWSELILDDPIRPLGFEDEQALLPYGPRSFQGYRLLQEYFAFPSRFLFANSSASRPPCAAAPRPIWKSSSCSTPRTHASKRPSGPAQFELYCTPAINLFPKRTDRIHLSESEYEYHVVPDRTRPMDFEIFQVTEVLGYGTSGDEKQDFLPFYALHDRTAAEDMSSYYTVHREPRMLSTKQRSQGARSSYVGSEIFLSLVDSTEAPDSAAAQTTRH